MLAGLYVRHYKVYRGATFIPFLEKEQEYLKLFIGNNGCGKSSILEALDTFFNNAPWNIHLDSKKKEAFIAPLFLIEKQKAYDQVKDEESQYVLERISNFFWNVEIEQDPNYRFIAGFFGFRDKLKDNYSKDYLLLFVGINYEEKEISFPTFDQSVRKHITSDNIRQIVSIETCLANIKHFIQNTHSYLYIPVETSVEQFLKLEARGMQELMNKNVKDSIEEILKNKKVVSDSEEENNKGSILSYVNKELREFVNQVESTIKSVDSRYSFQADFGATNLTASDLTDRIIESYFAKRNLTKDKKRIAKLSSGERRKALIDIVYAFLSQDGIKSKEIILAIDEPESSLHISMCYEQFEMLEKIANVHKCEIFVATHWYGVLPVLENGIIHHLDYDENSNTIIKSFSCKNYFEQRKQHPNDVYFKSFFDLTSSIISSLRNKEMNWIIVEGTEDKIYLSYYLRDKFPYKIIPTGGAGVVKLLYQYLYLPVSQNTDAKVLKGKIFCLIDTDKQFSGLIPPLACDTPNKKLRIKRLQYDAQEIKLLDLENPNKEQTEIEDVLVPSQYYEALKISIERHGNDEVREAFSQFRFDVTAKFSFIRGDESILSHIGTEGRIARNDKQVLMEFIDNYKKEIAETYIKLPLNSEPKWINELYSYFVTVNTNVTQLN